MQVLISLACELVDSLIKEKRPLPTDEVEWLFMKTWNMALEEIRREPLDDESLERSCRYWDHAYSLLKTLEELLGETTLTRLKQKEQW